MVGVPGKGSLLVASPTLADPNFSRSVIFVLAHDDDEGTLGVVLNRPSIIPVDEIVPGWGGLAAAPSVLFTGGPVQPSAAICIGRAGAARGSRGGRLRAPRRSSRHHRPSRRSSRRPGSPGGGPCLHRIRGLGTWPACRRDPVGIVACARGPSPGCSLGPSRKGSGPRCSAVRVDGSPCCRCTHLTCPRTEPRAAVVAVRSRPGVDRPVPRPGRGWEGRG